MSRLSRAQELCELSRQATAATGASLSVAVGGSQLLSTVCGTDVLSLRLEELQMGLGEGPIADALESGSPVLVPDLADVSPLRWVWFTRAAVEAGAGAVFVFPLAVGKARLGALSLYRSSKVGPTDHLTAEEFHDFTMFAEAATLLLVGRDTNTSKKPGEWILGEGTCFQPQIPQAVGMIMAELLVDAKHAMAWLRGLAFAEQQAISEAADMIVNGRLRLESDAA